MKNFLLLLPLVCLTFMVHAQNSADQKTTGFNPSIKMKGLIQARFENSLTDSVDVNGKFNPDPVRSNFQVRRLELRADISLNAQWSGVIRIQFPALKTAFPGAAVELAYFQWKYNDAFLIRGGQMKLPYELDELTSHEDLRMIDRGPTSRLITVNSLASYQAGVMIQGTFMKDQTPLSYYAGIFNGSDRTVQVDKNTPKNLIGRVEYNPIKTLRLGVNAQYAPFAAVGSGISGGSAGGDVSLLQPLNDKLFLIVEGEYIGGTNISSYTNSSDSVKDVSDYQLTGYFGQALLRIKSSHTWCQTFEIGGRFEHTDPTKILDTDAFNTITGGIGFIFLPDNDARLQLNLVQTTYQQEIPGVQKNNLMFVMQLQLKI
jgi:hypothetical protein